MSFCTINNIHMSVYSIMGSDIWKNTEAFEDAYFTFTGFSLSLSSPCCMAWNKINVIMRRKSRHADIKIMAISRKSKQIYLNLWLGRYYNSNHNKYLFDSFIELKFSRILLDICIFILWDKIILVISIFATTPTLLLL